MPAVDRRLDHARILRPQVADHHIGPAHIEAAALLDAGHGLEPRLHPGQQPADRAELVEHRRIERDHRRRLGDAVAFENADAEFLHIDAARRFPHRLGAGENVAQRAEIVVVGRARIAREERVGAEQDGGVGAVDHLRHDPVMQRRRIHEDPHAMHQRQNEPDRQPERVEHREHVEHRVAPPEIDARLGLRGIGEDVAMRQHDTFGNAFRARGEQDRGGVVRLARDERELGFAHAAQLVAERHGRPQVFEIDDAVVGRERIDELLQPALLDKGARGDDRIDRGGAAGGCDIRRTGAEIEHGGNAARRHQPENGDDRPVRVRQQQADRLAFGGERQQLAAEHGGAEQQATVGEGARHRVFDRDPAHAVRLRGVDHRFRDRAIGRGGAKHEVGHDLVERGARCNAPLLALQLGVDIELDRLEDRHRDLREELAPHLAAVEARERRLLEALDPDRHDHRVGFVGDEPGPVIDLHQAAGHGETPLRENDERLAGLHRADEGARAPRLGGVERHRAGEMQERLHPPALGNRAVDGEYGVLFEDRKRQRRVEEAHMVQGDDRIGAGLGDVLEAVHFEPEKGAKYDREEIAHGIGRQRSEHGDRDGEIGEAEQHEQHRGRYPGELHERDRDPAHHHEGGVEHVVGGDDAGAMLGPSPGLERGERRHDEQPARDRHAGEIDPDMVAAEGREHVGYAAAGFLARYAKEPPAEIEAEHAEEQRPDDGRQQHDAPACQPGGERGAEPDRDGEHREIDGDHLFRGAERVLDERRHQGERDRAREPEPAHHQRRPPQPPLGLQVAEQGCGRTRDVLVDREIRRALAGARNEQRRRPAQHREADHQSGKRCRIAAPARGKPAHNGAEQDGDEGRALDQGVAGRKLGLGEMVGQDAVFDRPEQRGDNPEQEQRHEEQRDGMQPKPENGDERDADLGEFEPLRDKRLVEPVRGFAAKRREDEIGKDEDRAGQRNQRLRA